MLIFTFVSISAVLSTLMLLGLPANCGPGFAAFIVFAFGAFLLLAPFVLGLAALAAWKLPPRHWKLCGVVTALVLAGFVLDALAPHGSRFHGGPCSIEV
jgi:VIT1/CCC1 family predicted Fe2+/Mn2+ transporter